MATRKTKPRSPYEGHVNELEQLRKLANEAFVAMVDAYDNAQYYEFHYLAGYMEPLKDALETLEQVVINLIDLEKSN